MKSLFLLCFRYRIIQLPILGDKTYRIEIFLSADKIHSHATYLNHIMKYIITVWHQVR